MTDLFSGSRRYLVLWLPLLSTDRLHRLRQKSGAAPAERPLVVLTRVHGALRIAHADRRALAAGLSPGLTLADARARVPDFDTEDEDLAADRAALEHIADWCDRWTPLVGLDGEDGILLDVTGCTHLFGGETAMRAGIMRRLTALGFTPRSALASTPDAARALARYTPGGVVAAEKTTEVVRPLPVAALGLDDDIVIALARAGLKTVADLADRPRAPLAARFGAGLLDRLSRTLGETDHPISPRRPLPELAAERRFAEPIGRAEDVAGTLEELARDLGALLAERDHGGRRFEASFFRADGVVRRIPVLSGRPLRDAKRIAALFAERLDALADPVDPGFGFDLIRLAALASEAALPAQTRLGSKENSTEAVAELVDRLGARFGAAHVTRYVPQDSHIPERATLCVPAISPAIGSGDWTEGTQSGDPPARPLRLLEPPEPIDNTLSEVPDGPPIRFRWRRVTHEVARAEGPERIAPEWWREPKAETRDYFRVEDREGRRFWLYREGAATRPDEAPRWFLHGLFA